MKNKKNYVEIRTTIIVRWFINILVESPHLASSLDDMYTFLCDIQLNNNNNNIYSGNAVKRIHEHRVG